MDLSLRNILRAAVVALAVGLAVNVYGIDNYGTGYQVIACLAVFIALVL